MKGCELIRHYPRTCRDGDQQASQLAVNIREFIKWPRHNKCTPKSKYCFPEGWAGPAVVDISGYESGGYTNRAVKLQIEKVEEVYIIDQLFDDIIIEERNENHIFMKWNNICKRLQ